MVTVMASTTESNRTDHMLVRWVIALLALAAAPIMVVQSAVNAGLSVPQSLLSWNGFRLASRSRSMVAMEQEGQTLRVELPPGAERLALQAYAKEPLATDALFVLALAEGAADEELLAEAAELNGRNRAVGLMLLQQAIERGDIESMMSLIDRLARLRPNYASNLVAALQASLSDDASVDAIEKGLRESPAWAEAFWRTVPKGDPEQANYLELYRSLQPELDEAGKRNLISALAANERYEDAFEAFAQLSKDNEQLQMPPLDWRTSNKRGIKANVEPNGSISVYLDTNSAGELARKLVELGPGRFSVNAKTEIAEGEGTISVQLECLSKSSARSGPQAVEAAEWDNQDGSCTYGWLILSASSWDSPSPFRAVIYRVNFSRRTPPL